MKPLPVLLATALLTTSGCAMTEAQVEARDYRRIDFEEQFKADRRQCLARGGRIYVNAASNVGRDGIPQRGDRYFCA